MAGGDSGRRGRWRRLLQVAISAVALWLIVRNVDLAASARLLAHARWGWVAAALALYLASQAMSAYRWWLIGSAVGAGDRLARYLQVYFISMFFLFFGPSTLGGDVVRSLYLAAGRRRRAAAINAVVLDRLNGLVVLIAIGAVAFVLFPGYRLPALLLYATVGLAAALVAGAWSAPALARRLLAPQNPLRRFVTAHLEAFWRDRRMLLQASAVSLVFHLVQIATQWMVTRALDLPVPFPYICIYHPLVSALSALPITFSGLGLREGGYVWFFARIGIDEASAVAFGALWLLVIVGASLFGGLVFLASGARLPALVAGGEDGR